MPQHLALITLLVRDYDHAIAFYVHTLGFSLLEDTDRGHGKRWVRVAPPAHADPASPTPAAALLLAPATTPAELASVGNQTGGRVFLFLHTDNFWRDYHALTARGVKFVREPVQQEYGVVAVFEDLYGNRFDLIGPGPIAHSQ